MSISIINKYIDNLFPVFRIVLDIDTSTYYKILKNKSTVKFKIRLQKFYRKGINNAKVSLYDDYLSKTFSLILDDDDNDFEEDIRKKAYGEDELNELFAKKNQIEFFLFDSELLNSFKKTINVIIDNGTVTNVLIIKNHTADMVEATCPDKLCIKQKAISKDNESIVCLPNKVIATVTSNTKSDIDVISQ